jgi:tetratricopeptide (TPR) repeat protein
MAHWSAGRIEAAPPDAGPPVGGAAITQKEAEEFGKALEAATAAGDSATFNSLIDWNAIADRGTQTPNLPELQASRSVFKQEVLRTLQKSDRFFAELSRTVKSGGNYTFLRAELKGKEPFVQFRMTGANNAGLNYHRMYLVRRPEGRVVAADLFVLMSGERMSETLSHGWLPVATAMIRKNAKGANGTADLDAELAIGQKIVELNAQGKHQELLEVYKNAPESTRRNTAILVICLLAAQKVSNDEYGAMIEAFRKYHPDNPALDFIMIDGFILKEKYDEALASVDRAMKQIGADAGLLCARANILTLAKRFPQAVADIHKAIAAEPDFSNSYSMGVDVALTAQDHAATLEFLTALEKKFGLEFLDLAGSESFANFVKSPQFKTWQAAHGEK